MFSLCLFSRLLVIPCLSSEQASWYRVLKSDERCAPGRGTGLCVLSLVTVSHRMAPGNAAFQHLSVEVWDLALRVFSPFWLCDLWEVHVFPSRFFLFYVLFYFWSIIALQCYVSFCCTTKWISYMYTYPLPLVSSSHAPLIPLITEHWLSSLCSTAASHSLFKHGNVNCTL